MIHAVQEAVCDFIDIQHTENEREYIQNRMKKIEQDLASRNLDVRMDAVQELLFMGLISPQLTWADFSVLDVMTSDNFSAKRIAYTAASQLWNSNSDVVLMATNRIQKDLTSSKPLIASIVLSSIPPYLSPVLAQYVSGDVIKLMTSSKLYVKLKAIMCFYSVCLHYPDALKAGFPTLRSLLDDSDSSVVMSVLNVLFELCMTNPSNMIQMIPKLFKMLTQKSTNWVTLKLIQIMTVLGKAEPRLAKKLVDPYAEIMSNAQSLSVVYECARSIVEIPVNSPSVMKASVTRIHSYVYSKDPSLRSLFVAIMMSLLKLQPKLCTQYRDLITECLDSDDEGQRLMALDLLATMANSKNLDKIVEKMYDHFKGAYTVRFRNEIITAVISLSSQNDYEFVSDFEWYVDVLMDFVNEAGFTCYKIIADQILDLAMRVPSVRDKLTKQIGKLFADNYMYKDAVPLLLACAHILGAFGTDAGTIETVMSRSLLKCNERVQQAYSTATMKYFVMAENGFPVDFAKRMNVMLESQFPAVQNEVESYVKLLELLEDKEVASDMREKLLEQERVLQDVVPVAFPDDFTDPNPLFQGLVDGEEPESELEPPKRAKSRDGKRKPKRRQVRRQKEPSGEKLVICTTRSALSNDSHEDKKTGVLSQGLADVQLDLDEDGKPVVTEHEARPRRSSSRRVRKSSKATEPEQDDNIPMQVIAEQAGLLKITLETVEAVDDEVTFGIALENLSDRDIPSVVFAHNDTATCTSVDVSPYRDGLKPRERAEHELTFSFARPVVPQLVRLIISPMSCGAEAFEGKVKVFPSYFLAPAQPDSFDFQQCENESQITAHINISPQVCVKCIVKLLRCKVMPDRTTKVISMYSATSYGEHVVATFTHSSGQVVITIKSTDATLSESLMKEVEMRLTSL